jgi:hypothetical protein
MAHYTPGRQKFARTKTLSNRDNRLIITVPIWPIPVSAWDSIFSIIKELLFWHSGCINQEYSFMLSLFAEAAKPICVRKHAQYRADR